MFTLREFVESIGPDAEPLECAFLIAMILRSAVQGEASTFEGECASICMAMRLGIDTKTGDGIRAWLADLGAFADFPLPDRLLLAIAATGDE